MEPTLLSTGALHKNIPENYIRPESQRPKLSLVSDCEDVPVIDLGIHDHSQKLKQVHFASKDYGFFQVRLRIRVYTVQILNKHVASF